ncbi:type II toxin-antitoxin system VapC family toxin [Candidatus Trichorickettsia mobilis]|uniref:type II toxin-antitoxin system VapC family toxin n=1 Tax=Candidatus Trichorickettsia mobilis TaxID=1346319 RepID=UPI0029303804|nr:PIN domain-containing protein [Candidatus Trichorickettsia mobilis]
MIDTHIVIWLYAGTIEEVSTKAQKHIESNELLISPIILLELQYLFEIGKISVDSETIYNDLHFRIGLRIDHETLWSRIIKEALMLNWTRDPFDRIIVAHASVLGYNLISKDQLIKLNFNNTIW